MPRKAVHPRTAPDVYEIRRANLRDLVERSGGPTRVALKLGHSNGSLMSQLVGPHPSRTIGEKFARTAEQKLGYEPGYLDKPHTTAPALSELKGQCQGVVAGLMLALKLTVAPAKRDEVVAMALEDAQRRGQVDPDLIERLLRLAV